jgi:predicted metal-dependent peptidase
MSVTIEQRIERAKVALMRDPEYMMLGSMFMFGKTTVVDDPQVTAATDGVDTIYGRAFVTGLTEAELRGLVIHETQHIAYRHLDIWAHLAEQDADRANRAMDFVINLPINDRHSRDGFVKMPPDGCLDEAYRGMDTAQVFKLLAGNGGGKGGGGGFDSHDWAGASKRTPQQQAALAKQVESSIRQGGIFASKAGGAVDRKLIDMLSPKIRWQDALREFAANTVAGSDYSSYRNIDRRLMSQGVVLPATYTDQVPRVVIAVDSSGSIQDKELVAFISETVSVCESVAPDMVDLLYWGSHVAQHELYTKGNYAGMAQATKPKGGGGTSPSCIHEYLADKGIQPCCIIILTDGDVFGDWGTAWNAPVLWVITDSCTTAQTGSTIHLTL